MASTSKDWDSKQFNHWNHYTKDKTPMLVAIVSAFYAVTLISLGLRFYTRLAISRTLGADDWFMFVAQLLYTVFYGFSLTAGSNGAGKLMSELSKHEIQGAIKYWYFAELTYIACATFFRISVAIFIIRVTVERSHRIILMVVSLVTTVFSTFIFFLLLFSCTPITHYWVKVTDPFSRGHCMPVQSAIDALYAGSAVAATADFVFALMPFVMLRNAPYLTRSTKIMVAIILGMGSVSGIAVLARVPYIKDMNNGNEVVFSTIGLALWTIIEPGVGMLSANLACLRPLIRKCKNKWNTHNGRVKTWKHSRSNSSRTHIGMTPQPWNVGMPYSERYSNETALSEKVHGRDRSTWSPRAGEVATNTIREQPSLRRMVDDGLSDLREIDGEDLVVQISKPQPLHRHSGRRDMEEYCLTCDDHDNRTSISLRK